jgi:hypothetical protein
MQKKGKNNKMTRNRAKKNNKNQTKQMQQYNK